jgi:hypothetical protein
LETDGEALRPRMDSSSVRVGSAGNQSLHPTAAALRFSQAHSSPAGRPGMEVFGGQHEKGGFDREPVGIRAD